MQSDLIQFVRGHVDGLAVIILCKWTLVLVTNGAQFFLYSAACCLMLCTDSTVASFGRQRPSCNLHGGTIKKHTF